MSDEIWLELATTMRRLRQAHGVSLRQLEKTSRWRRGTLSQVETAQLRPTAEQVSHYDDAFEGHGLLLALYILAKTAQTDKELRPLHYEAVIEPGDAFDVVDYSPASGTLVMPGARVTAKWKLQNVGSVAWQQRSLRRLGAAGGERLIGSAPSVEIPTAAPGEVVSAECELTMPDHVGTVIAYWHMVHGDNRPCFPFTDMLSILLLVS